MGPDGGPPTQPRGQGGLPEAAEPQRVALSSGPTLGHATAASGGLRPWAREPPDPWVTRPGLPPGRAPRESSSARGTSRVRRPGHRTPGRGHATRRLGGRGLASGAWAGGTCQAPALASSPSTGSEMPVSKGRSSCRGVGGQVLPREPERPLRGGIRAVRLSAARGHGSRSDSAAESQTRRFPRGDRAPRSRGEGPGAPLLPGFSGKTAARSQEPCVVSRCQQGPPAPRSRWTGCRRAEEPGSHEARSAEGPAPVRGPTRRARQGALLDGTADPSARVQTHGRCWKEGWRGRSFSDTSCIY